MLIGLVKGTVPAAAGFMPEIKMAGAVKWISSLVANPHKGILRV